MTQTDHRRVAARTKWPLMAALLVVGLAPAASGEAPPGQAMLAAFPGAQGHGRFARGGRGGRVLIVTSLADDGPGTLRDAVQARGPRTVVFAVGGTITLDRPLDVNRGRLTIAGQTAPGPGITLRGHGLNVKADDVVIRYLRVRPGDDAGTETDAISVQRGHDIIIDHCSASWATDETLSISPSDKRARRPIDNVTVQWSIISESLNQSVHSKGDHGYGSLVRGNHGARYSLHHNLWAHHMRRMPRPGNYLPVSEDPDGPLIEFNNNVFYNWGGRYSGYNADTESRSRYDFVANYYLPGPDSSGTIAFVESSPFASLYFDGNYMQAAPITDPADVLQLPPGSALADMPHLRAAVDVEPAPVAYDRVLNAAGASLRRDAIDRRIIADVRNTAGRIIDDEEDVGGWIAAPTAMGPADTDGDGMPDAWEEQHGFDPLDPVDGSCDRNRDGYTNLEDYLNSLVPPN